MAFKSNIDTSPRIFYTQLGGNDDQAGDSLETCKATIQGAVTAVNALTLTANNRASLIVGDAGNYSESITLPAFTTFEAAGTVNAVTSGIAYTMNNGSIANLGIVTSTVDSSSVIQLSNISDVVFKCTEIQVSGTSSSAVSLALAIDNIAGHVDQIRCIGTSSTGIFHTATSANQHESIDVESITLEGTSTVGILQNTATSDVRSVFNVGAIFESGTVTGTVGLRVVNGHMVALVNEIAADTAIDVQAGTLSLVGNTVTGNIDVASGATLICDIAEFTGTVTNNGTIRGRIGNNVYGDVDFIDNVVIDGDLTVNGTSTTINTDLLNAESNYINAGFGYTSTVQQTGGLTVNLGSTGTEDTVNAGAFVAGVAATSNATVATVSASTFALNDIIEISGTANQGENDGLYEVISHTSNTLTVRGIGTTDTVEAFTKRDFVANASDNAGITKVTIAVNRSDTSGGWEVGSGSVTPITYTSVTAGEANVQSDWNETDQNSDAFILNKPSTLGAIPSVHNLSTDIPSRVDLNTDLNVAHNFTFDISNHNSITNATLIVTPGDNKILVNPSPDGIQTQLVVLSGISTASAGTVEFRVSLQYVGGSTSSNTVTITIANLADDEQAYHGTRATNDFASVDVSLLTAVDVTQAGSQYSITGSYPNGETLGLLSPANRDPVSMVDRVIGNDSLGDFTAATNVRTIGSQQYNLLTLVNNSGFDGTYGYDVTTE